MLEKSRRVVIRGVGLVSCLGVSVASNWTRLLKNDSGITVLDPKIHGSSPCHIGGSVDNEALEARWIELLSNQALLRGVDKLLDRRAMSRASVLGMLASQEALKQCGWLPPDGESSKRDYSALDEISYRVGSHFSTGLEGIEEIITTQARIDKKGYAGMGAHVLPRSLANMPVAHISRAWGLRGPIMSCNTACASGLHSIGEAFRMIQHGEADMVLAGGSEAALNPWSLMAFSRIRALSNGTQPKEASRPFDSSRNGFVMSEGAGALVLEAWPPKNPSVSSSHPPIAEILGFGRSVEAEFYAHLCHEEIEGSNTYLKHGQRLRISDNTAPDYCGYEAEVRDRRAGDPKPKQKHGNGCFLPYASPADAFSLVSPEPSGDGAYRSMKAALDDAGIDSIDDLGHINCHATSTPIGDVIELSAVARLLSTYGKRSSSPAPIQVNSIKGHLGHCLGAAGAVEAVYSALSVQNGVCVANRNLEKPISPDDVIKTLEHLGNKEVARKMTESLFENISFEADHDWAKRSKRRLVLTNSFGFGGMNGTLLLSNWIE